jgi:hypothetical protein
VCITISEDPQQQKMHGYQHASNSLGVDITDPAPSEVVQALPVKATADVTGGPTAVIAWLSTTNGGHIPCDLATHMPGTTSWNFTWNNVNNGNYLVTAQATAGSEQSSQSVPFGVDHP